MSVTGASSGVTLQQFVTENPGAQGLANVLKTKGMSDAEIVALLQKGKDEWIGGGGSISLEGADRTSGKSNVGESLGKIAGDHLHADIFTFMALFQKMAQEMRQTARIERESMLQQQVSTLQSAADQIKNAAQARFNAAIISGACQIGAGVMQVGSAGMSARSLSKGTTTGTDGVKSVSQEAITRAGNWTTAGQGVGQIMQGAGQIASGSQELAAGEADAKGKRLDAQAKIEEEARNKANDVMQQMQDIIRDIRDKLSAIEQSNVEANRGIARNI